MIPRVCGHLSLEDCLFYSLALPESFVPSLSFHSNKQPTIPLNVIEGNQGIFLFFRSERRREENHPLVTKTTIPNH